MPDNPIDASFQPPTVQSEETGDASSPDGITLTWPEPGFDPATSYGTWSFGLTIHYLWDSGLRYAPKAASARAQVAIWRSSSEVSLKIVECVSARFDAIPVMPHVDTNDPNDVLLSRQVSAPSRMVLPDGSQMVVIVQRATYVCQMAHTLEQALTLPNDVLFPSSSPAQIYPGTFSTQLLGAPCPPGDFSGGRITY